MTTHGGFAPTSSASLQISEVPSACRPEIRPDRAVTPSVTVVICAYTEQRWSQIVRAVRSVLTQEVPTDQVVVVVDHNDDLLVRVRAAFPKLTVVSSTGPRGLSGARNTGVAYARGDILAFLDDDAEAEPDWLARLLPHYRDSSVLAVGGRAVPVWEGARPLWLPREFDWVVGCSFAGQPTRASPVRNVIGCNMSFRRAVLDHVNGFDPALGRAGNIPVGCEETELCIRIRQAYPDGIVLYEPRALVRHQVTAERATWRYFRRRCFSEGRSKAVVAHLVGSGAGLSEEREYTRRVLPKGAWRGLREIRDGDRTGVLRSATIFAGLLVTASGYASARALRVSHTSASPAKPRRGEAPASVRVVAVELSEGVPSVPDEGGLRGSRYGAARVLVRLHGQPVGLLDIELPAGGLTAEAHAAAIGDQLSEAIDGHLRDDGLPPPGRLTPQMPGLGASCPSLKPPAVPAPRVSVVMPTCGRTPLLGRSLDSVAALDYPNFEVVVVDNAPHLESTARLVAKRAALDPRVRYTSEPRAGVTHARNRGLAEARGEIVAFADDDVMVDRRWLRALVDGFTDGSVAAVTGHVLADELETPAQIWVEHYGGFGKGCLRRRFDRTGFETVEDGTVRRVEATPASLYPYLPGTYGSGANMAFRTAVLRRLGGFDPRLRTGEDIDVLMRLVLAGHPLVYEPAAIVWHTHRREVKALRRSIYHYGVGLSAVMVKCLVTDAAGRRDLLKRLPSGIAYALDPQSEKNGGKRNGYPALLTILELCGMALGPVYYAAAAWSARSMRKGI